MLAKTLPKGQFTERVRRRADGRTGCDAALTGLIFFGILTLWHPVCEVHAETQVAAEAEALLRAGRLLSANTHFIEALDHLNEARDLLEEMNADNTRMYGDVLYALASAKIRGRLRQGFPAAYVKSALRDIQACNVLRERIGEALPQESAEGWFLEGYIQKRFFMRKNEAVSCFMRAVSYDPAFAPAKRELSELIVESEDKRDAE